jgi:hypothetical protein
MLNIPYYHSLFKKYVIIFGTLFNNIRIERLNADGTIAQNIRVPIAYGPREKYLARAELNPTGTAKQAIQLPIMSFELTNIAYASDRKLQTTRSFFTTTANTSTGDPIYKKTYTPVPYDLTFELGIMTKTVEDATRIVEQILPYFTPEWTISARLLEDFDQLTDIPIIIETVNINDQYDSNFEQRRALTYTLTFTMKAYLYGPIVTSKVIKITNINYTNPIDITQPLGTYPVMESQTIQPGLDANGNPTTILANTIPYSQIADSDPYGIINTITLNANGAS